MLIVSLIASLLIFQYDVDTVAFADESGNLIYPGSDNNLWKVARFYKLLCQTIYG